MNPTSFLPSVPSHFIGPAAARAKTLHAKATAMRKAGNGTLKVLLYGVPGVGKTRIADMVAACLTKHPTEIESLNGRDVTIECVRRWMESLRYRSLLGGWTVKIVNELDLCTPAAQDLLLSYLDSLPGCHAFIGTSNLRMDMLAERFQTRLQQLRVDAPSTDELSAFLKKNWKLAQQAAAAIAVGSGGNVRAALLDAETFIDERSAA